MDLERKSFYDALVRLTKLSLSFSWVVPVGGIRL